MAAGLLAAGLEVFIRAGGMRAVIDIATFLAWVARGMMETYLLLYPKKLNPFH